MLFHHNRRPLLTAAFVLLLGYSAAAQNAPTPVSVPTGDIVLYGRHSASAGNSSKQAQDTAQAQALTPHERRMARWQYQNQHRSEFPSVYRPGVE